MESHGKSGFGISLLYFKIRKWYYFVLTNIFYHSGGSLAAGGATGVAGEIGIKATGLRAELYNANKSRSSIESGGANFDGVLGTRKKKILDEGDASKIYIGSITILSFSGAIGLYGFIMALIITSQSSYTCSYD